MASGSTGSLTATHAQRATPPIFPPYDLLSAILAEADKSTCVKAAVVCRSWYEPALNELWRVVTNARDILEVLAPMEEKYIRYRRRNPIYDLHFVRDITPEDWTRFLRIAIRVRVFSDIQFDDLRLSPTAFGMIQSTCPTANVFPSLRSLETTTTSLAQGTIFFAPTITNLNLRARSSASDETLVLCSFEAITRMVRIRRLGLDGYLNAASHVTNAISMLKTLDHLVEFEFTAPASVIPLLMDVLSSLPRIRRVGLTHCDKSRDVNSAALSPPVVVTPGFQDLQSVSAFLSSTNHSVLHDILFRHSLQNLKSLLIGFHLRNVRQGSEPRRDRDLFLAIANACPSVVKLSVFFYPHVEDPPAALNYTAMEPIVTRLHLVSFEVVHDLPIDLTLDNLYQIVKAWGPTLKSFHLNCGPRSQGETSLNLSALVPFTRKYCPKLTLLHLYIDARSPVDPTPLMVEHAGDPLMFSPHLASIHFGNSPIDQPWHVVVFLQCLVCPYAPKFSISGDDGDDDWSESDESEADAMGVHAIEADGNEVNTSEASASDIDVGEAPKEPDVGPWGMVQKMMKIGPKWHRMSDSRQ